ncbi:P-loop containing nucleoside triphosphate hydrolase protein [Suillus plorans]|uniref:P-loop containing nucleoside triphosphate hydrolase protein n=1 Tax=Suillus plorans TaxID=116603 RepID=A0A9P7AF81_9AGAM|nr:P-loop containing nucleoside triphosphate hydrolase protein [Suillus plorans]KAG1787230.1 P-loop containing nucleoside triphosphate hydrolase protein [Suillus plorans]
MLGFGLGVNSWRHVSTTFKRKLGRFAEDLSEDDEQDTVEALEASHNRSTENRIYGLSPDALAGAPEDLLPLSFLQASTNWQLVMHTVPGGLQLAYTLARSHEFKQLAESGKFGSDFQGTNSPAAAAAVAAPPQCAEVISSIQNQVMAKIKDELVAGIECKVVVRIVDALVPAVETMIRDALATAMPQQYASQSDDCWPKDQRLEYVSPEETHVMGGSQETTQALSTADDSEVWYEEQTFRSTNEFTSSETGQGAIGLGTTSPPSADSNKLAGVKLIPLNDDNDLGSDPLKAINILSDDEQYPPPPPNQLVKNKDSILARKSLWTLRILLGDQQANWWSSQQKDAVLSVLKRETDIIAILRTWGGKSMLAIIPAIMDANKAVVVVLPLKSLMTDWERKLKAMRVPFQVYDPSVPLLKDVNLVLVSADKAKFKTEAMQYMQEIRQLSMQLVLLTGTPPQSSVAALKAAFDLADNAIEIRESINRPELEYIMKAAAPSNAPEDMVIQIVACERQRWTSDDRGLVFVTYLEDGESLANKAGWPFYNRSKGMSDASRAHAFSTGNDYPHVRVVIHLKTPLEMTEIIQAQGRGGRDGRLARCYILPSSTPPKIAIGRWEVDHKGLCGQPQSTSASSTTSLTYSSDPFAKAHEQAEKFRADRLDEEMKRVERIRQRSSAKVLWSGMRRDL